LGLAPIAALRTAVNFFFQPEIEAVVRAANAHPGAVSASNGCPKMAVALPPPTPIPTWRLVKRPETTRISRRPLAGQVKATLDGAPAPSSNV